MKQLKKTLLTLVALLAVTTGAWAQTEELLTSITTDDFRTITYSTAGCATLTTSGNFEISRLAEINGEEIYGWTNPRPSEMSSLTVTPSEGYTITKVVFKGYEEVDDVAWYDVFTDTEAPYTCYMQSAKVSLSENMANSTWDYIAQIDVYGYAAASASSGPEVAWDKAKNSGSFTMPGGNVTLEPEYYPQAALAAAPTAINDVPATTDGAIVKAGTVKNIGSTETAQGTVMYYVSKTALDDAALLALAADKWTADVPTAEKLTKGQAYVYYYVRGNDSDNDAENFSDGDILAANALTVTIAAEPTYAVTFADGTEESDKWTASPAADVKKGQTVTVTYTGSKKVIGVKAEKKAKAPTTVTWNSPNFQGTTYTQDGVTLTPSSGDGAFSNALYEYGENTFTTTLGKFTKIEIVCTGNNLDGWTKETAGKFQPNPDGDPEYWKDLFKMTWTGNAESVTLIEKYVYEIQSITFTIQ